MSKNKPETPSEVKGSTEHNADDAAVNETSQKFDRSNSPQPGADQINHPRVRTEDLQKSEHYVSLKDIKQSEKENGGGTTGSPNVRRDKPEPTPDLGKADTET